ncbi:MAG: helix-turn-helix transcriptional regulator [bacterium]|nr:helix-turn-helix transcriptional regulator [bacterium]
MILLIQGKVPGRMMRTGLFIFPAGLLIVYMAGLINFLYTDSRSLLVFADSAVPYSIIIVMLAFIIAKYFDVRKSGEADNANILKTLLLFYFLSILFMTLNDAFFSRFYMLIRGSIFLLMIIFPVLWLRSSYFRSIRNIFPASGEVDFELFGSTYNLSEREKDVFKLILQGHSNKEIQDKLCIALHTVKNHNYNIYKKLGIRSRGELFKLVLDWTNQQ